MSEDRLTSAADAVTRATDGTDTERAEALAETLRSLADRAHGPDHGRLARIENALVEVREEATEEASAQVGTPSRTDSPGRNRTARWQRSKSRETNSTRTRREVNCLPSQQLVSERRDECADIGHHPDGLCATAVEQLSDRGRVDIHADDPRRRR